MEFLDVPAQPVEGPAACFGRSLAVVIGIDAYSEGIPSLSNAVADARAIAQALEDDHGFETWCLVDASRARLLALLREELPAALGDNDRLLFYFAGHGIALDGTRGPVGYLLPADAQRADSRSFLPMSLLHDELAGLPVRHALVVLDCCFAGTFRWSSLRDVAPPPAKLYRERYDRYIESSAWQVLTSASGVQLALDAFSGGRREGDGGHSPFARALLDGLRGGANYTGDNLITAEELALFVSDRVGLALEDGGHRQVPQLFPLDRHEHGQFLFQVPHRPLALAPAPPLDEEGNPYRGLESFREQDRGLFFGREEVTARLIEAVIAQRLTVVVGPSGSGKSSLVLAGLVPALRARGWTVLPPRRPGRSPLAALEAWTCALAAEPDPRDPAGSWTAAVARHAGLQYRLVVVDQLEELLTFRTPERERDAFLDALAAALDADPSLHLVVTVRSDAEPQLHDTALGRWWAAARFVVPGVTRDELRRIIEQPASAAVLHFQPARLAERLLDDVALVPAPLPLLSFALSELYRRCAARWRSGLHDRALQAADYEEMGSVARALTGRATALHDQLVAEDPAYANTIRNVFNRMATVVSGELARRRVRRSELRYGDLAEDRRVDEVLQRFHDARLISLGIERTRHGRASAYVEPMHDELVRGWPHVRRWLDELDRPPGTRALLSALGTAVRAWEAGQRPRALLWSDPRAELATALGRSRPFVFNMREARFVERSARLRRNRRVRLIGGLLAVIAMLSAAMAVALWEREDAIAHARRARDSEQLAVAHARRAGHNEQLALDQAERAGRNEQLAVESAERARQSEQLALEHAERAGRNEQLALAHAARAARNEAEARQRIAHAFRETGRRLLLEGHPERAIPYLVEARKAGGPVATLRMLFAMASRQIPTPLAHQGPVLRAVLGPDGRHVVTTSFDGTAQVWDAATGARVSRPLAHAGLVASAAFSADGRRVVTASYDGTARVWDAATGAEVLPPLEHRHWVVGAAFSPDGTRIVTASFDGTAQVWDAATGARVSRPLAHGAAVLGAVFSPDGRRIVTASKDRTARVWAAAGTLVATLAHGEVVVGAAFSPDGRRVVTASDDRTARVWAAATGAQVLPPLAHGDWVTSAAFSPDGRRVVTASKDGAARIWDAATGALAAPLLAHQDAVVSAVFSADSLRVVTASKDQTARVWSAETGVQLLAFEHQHDVSGAALSADGTRVVTASGLAGRVWDATGTPGVLPLASKAVVSTAFSADGKRVLTASKDGTVQVWDAATGAPVSPPIEPPGALGRARFSADDRYVVTVSADETERVWDAVTGAQASLPAAAHGEAVTGAARGVDRRGAAAAGGDGAAPARAADADAGRSGRPPPVYEGEVLAAMLGPQGWRIVTTSGDETARLWSAATGKPVSRRLEHQGAVVSAAFSADGRRVVTASADQTARVWDAETGAPVSPPLVHQGAVIGAAFSPDGDRLVTASRDRTAQIWDAETGAPLSPLLLHEGAVIGAAFSPDGGRLVTASEDGTARVWDIPLAGGTLAEWSAIAERSCYVLIGGVLAPRSTK